MTVSADIQQAMFAQETEDGLLILLTLDNAALAAPIRVVNNHVAVTSRGEEFSAFPFEVELPGQQAGGMPTGRLTIDNVSREIVEAIRTATGEISVLIEVVRLLDPDSLELSFPRLGLLNVRATFDKVNGDIVAVNLRQEPFPAGSFSPGYFPGLI